MLIIGGTQRTNRKAENRAINNAINAHSHIITQSNNFRTQNENYLISQHLRTNEELQHYLQCT